MAVPHPERELLRLRSLVTQSLPCSHSLGSNVVDDVLSVPPTPPTSAELSELEQEPHEVKTGTDSTMPRSWMGNPWRVAGSAESTQLKSGVYPVHQITFATSRTRPSSSSG